MRYSFLGGSGLAGLMAVVCMAQTAFGKQLPPPFPSSRSITGSNVGQSDDPATGTDGNLADKKKRPPEQQRVFDLLFQELSNVVPVRLKAGSDRKKAVINAVEAFIARDMKRLEAILLAQSQSDATFPPPKLLLAVFSYAVKDTRTGFALLEHAAAEAPEYPGIYLAFARLALNQGRLSDALAMFEKSSRVSEESKLEEEARDFFMREALNGSIDVVMRQRRYSEARKKVQALRESYPDEPKIGLVVAELEFLEGNIDKSLEQLEALQRRFPASRVPELMLSAWFMRDNNKDEAVKWIQAAAKKYPARSPVQLEYATWLIQENQFQSARAIIIKAEKLDGETLDSRRLKARIAFAEQAYGVAEAHYQVISSQRTGDFDASNMWALSLVESDDETKQQKALEVALRNFRSSPRNLIAKAALGYIYLKNGQKEMAEDLLTQVARSSGSAPEINFFLACFLADKGLSEKARTTLEAALGHKSFFLYRAPAEQLLASLGEGPDESEGLDELPDPGN